MFELRSGAAGLAARIRAAGGRVERRHGRLVQAWVPARRLDALAADPSIARARPPAAFVPMAVPGEGVAATNAPAWHAVGLNGTGVKVAVFDGGFAGLAERQAAGDIPASVVTVDFCGGRFAGPENHGTAVTEIVAEMAPGAQLYLVCIDTDVSLAQAEAYAKANGVQIVNLSGGFYNSWRGDGRGPPGTPDGVVADARANNILWVNSAGNEAMAHWGGTFISTGGRPFNEFAPGEEINAFVVPPGVRVCGFLRWDAWPVPSDDYDLGLYDLGLGRFVAASARFNARDRLPPTEQLCFPNTSGGARPMGFVIARFQGGAPPTFDLFVSPSPLGLTRSTAARSVVDPAASPNVLTVGAICWQTTGLEPYSSQGPTIDNQLKPDLTAPDSNSGATYGPFSACGRSGFPGTSASSPHAAGAAALVKQRFPTLPAADLQRYLAGQAADLGSPGPDNAYGAGRLALPAIPAPVATARAARGRFGRIVRLIFSLTDVQWPTKEHVDVFRGARRIASFDVPLALSPAGSVAWRAPKKPPRPASFRWCVQAADQAGQAGPRSCAKIALT